MYAAYAIFTSSSYQVCEPDAPVFGDSPQDRKTTARQRLARNLRLLRVMRGWSQEQFALAAGLDRTYVGALERGERNPTLANVEKLAEALGVEVRELLS